MSSIDDLFGSNDDDAEVEVDKVSPAVDHSGGTDMCPNVDRDDNVTASQSRHLSAPTAIDPIDGLYLFRDFISSALQAETVQAIIDAKAVSLQHPQAMIFPQYHEVSEQRDASNCPGYLLPLYTCLRQQLGQLLSSADYACVFDRELPLQTIINLYAAGQGISPHVDLPHRYAEPIIGISFCSSCVMEFTPVESGSSTTMLVRPGDVYVLLRSARYDYKHGIAYRLEDHFINEAGHQQTLIRGTRISVTFRRMLAATSLLTRDA